MLVGEAPGDAEDQAGRPFIGPAGAVLDEALDMAGLDRDTCYVTGAVKHFGFDMVNGRRQHRSPGPEETAACAGWLRRELELVDPEVVVLMGRTAIRAVLGRALAVGPNRGRIIPLGDRARAVVTVHPAHVLRQRELPREEALAGFAADLRLAVQAVAA
jgi:DNA polymerase